MGIRPLRVLLLIGIAGLGFHIQGMTGAIYMLCIFGFLCLLWYLACGALFNFVNLFQRPQQPMEITIKQGDSIKGHPDVEGTGKVRHPDPTRPDEEDFRVLTWRKPK